MANDISGTVAALVIANYCSARKIRWIGIGMIVVVIATLIPASATLFAEVRVVFISSLNQDIDSSLISSYLL